MFPFTSSAALPHRPLPFLPGMLRQASAALSGFWLVVAGYRR